MRNLDLESVVGVGQFINRQTDHFSVFDLSAGFMTVSPLSKYHDKVLVTEPFSHLFNRLAVGLVQSIARGEKDGKSGRFWFIILAKHGKIRGFRCKTVQFLVVELDLFLDEGTSWVEFFLKVVLGAWRGLYGLI